MMRARKPKSAKRPANERFNDYIQTQTEADGKLPLIHITRAYDFDAIVKGNLLLPQPCDVFREDLLYLFYGRPSYRAKNGNNARLEFEWPIIFVFDPDYKGLHIKRIFPFDTGAFALGLYKKFFDSKSQILDFALHPSLLSARKIVGTFYLNHEEYYSGSTRKNVELPLRQFEMHGVFELSRLPGVQDGAAGALVRDERSSAIEIQVSKPVSLKNSLLGIVLPWPAPGLDDTDLSEAGPALELHRA